LNGFDPAARPRLDPAERNEQDGVVFPALIEDEWARGGITRRSIELITTESTRMKTGLITVVTLASVMVLSGAALAGGESCASKKGAHKDMSAAISKDGIDPHGVAVSPDAVKTEPSAASGAEVKQEIPVQSRKGVLQI